MYNSYLCNNSNQGFQNNQDLNSLQNSNDFEYNPCPFNIELQNQFQNQNENGNNFSNNFGNGNNFDYDASENFCPQQVQSENFQVNNTNLTLLNK